MASLKEMLDIYNNCDHDCAICPNCDYPSYKCKLEQAVQIGEKNTIRENFCFTLKPVVGVSAEEWYLEIISQLVKKLEKYIDIKIFDKEILDNYEIEKAAKAADNLANMYKQKADLLRKQKRVEMTKEQLDFMKANYKVGDNND